MIETDVTYWRDGTVIRQFTVVSRDGTPFVYTGFAPDDLGSDGTPAGWVRSDEAAFTAYVDSLVPATSGPIMAAEVNE